MKYLLILQLLIGSQLFATKTETNEEIRKEKHIQEQIKKEKKYEREQSFYSGEKYDLKDAEVNMESVKNLPDVPDYSDAFDMDSAYD